MNSKRFPTLDKWSLGGNLSKVPEFPGLKAEKSQACLTFVENDILMPDVSFLTDCVNEDIENDWNKLVGLMNFLKATICDIVRLKATEGTTTGTLMLLLENTWIRQARNFLVRGP